MRIPFYWYGFLVYGAGTYAPIPMWIIQHQIAANSLFFSNDYFLVCLWHAMFPLFSFSSFFLCCVTLLLTAKRSFPCLFFVVVVVTWYAEIGRLLTKRCAHKTMTFNRTSSSVQAECEHHKNVYMHTVGISCMCSMLWCTATMNREKRK